MDTSTEEPIPSTSSKTPSTITAHQQFHQQQNQSTSAADGGGSNIFQFAINKKHSVSADYYDIDSILATTANVAATFDSGTPLGIFPLIGQKAPESIAEKGHRTVMPAWLLSAEIENICQFTVPSAYNKVNREVIAAGAKSGKLEATRLVARQRQFYALGRFICSHVHGEQRRQIAEQLLDAFTQRIGPVIMRAVDINSKPRDLLDEEEKQIFQAIQKTEHRRQEWIRREHRPEDRPHSSSQRQSVKRKFNGAF